MANFDAVTFSRSTTVCRNCGCAEQAHSQDDKRCLESATPKRVHVVSAPAGNGTIHCGMCRKLRTSCTCSAACQRTRNNDPIHESLTLAAEFIAETRYFGKDALETAGEMIQAARCDAFRKAANREMDGFLLKRIDEDSERLFARAKGKLFGTVLKLQERDTANKAPNRSSSRQLTNAEVIAQFKRNQTQVV